MRRLVLIIAAATALTSCARLQEAGGEISDVLHGDIGTGPRVAAPPPVQQAQAQPPPAAAPAPGGKPGKAPKAAKAPPAPRAPRQARAPNETGRHYTANDPSQYLHMTLEGLAKTVKDGSLKDGALIEVTAQVDGRFNRQIIIDLRLGEGQAASRRAGDCVQVLLPYFISQTSFNTGRYVVRGVFHRAYHTPFFTYEDNQYEPACGEAYIHARWVDPAP